MKTFEEYLEAKQLGDGGKGTTPKDYYLGKTDDVAKRKDMPPQGKDSYPYFGPNSKNSSKAIRVAEKPDDALGDKGSPQFNKPTDVQPYGEKPSKDMLKVEKFVSETRDMTNAEFVEALLQERENSKKKVNPNTNTR